MPTENIKKRIQALTPEYRQLILSDFLDITVDFFAQNTATESVNKTVLENCILLYFLLFIDKYELMELIVKNGRTSLSTAIDLVSTMTESLPDSLVSEMKLNYDQLLSENDSISIKMKSRNKVLENTPYNNQYKYLLCKTNTNIISHLIKSGILDEDIQNKTSQLIGDIALGFYKIEDTVPLLQQELGLDAKTAALLGADVLDFLTPLSDPNWQPPVEDSPQNIPDTDMASVATPSFTSVEQSVPEPELPQLRTMAADMMEERSPVRSTFNPIATLDEPIYQSTQPAIEKKVPEAPSYTAPLYQPPKPNVDAPLEKPRWG